MSNDLIFDFDRRERIGLAEAVLCQGKSADQISRIVHAAQMRNESLLLTRLGEGEFRRLSAPLRDALDYDRISGTAILGAATAAEGSPGVCVAAAGTSDYPVAREAARTLAFHGTAADEIVDIGVAGLWRVLAHQEKLRGYRIVIVVAGMDGALFSVIGGLVSGAVIAVPTSTGYGVADGGRTALHSALTSCAPGVVSVNIGNGYGAACAALRILRCAQSAETALPRARGTMAS